MSQPHPGSLSTSSISILQKINSPSITAAAAASGARVSPTPRKNRIAAPTSGDLVLPPKSPTVEPPSLPKPPLSSLPPIRHAQSQQSTDALAHPSRAPSANSHAIPRQNSQSAAHKSPSNQAGQNYVTISPFDANNVSSNIWSSSSGPIRPVSSLPGRSRGSVPHIIPVTIPSHSKPITNQQPAPHTTAETASTTINTNTRTGLVSSTNIDPYKPKSVIAPIGRRASVDVSTMGAASSNADAKKLPDKSIGHTLRAKTPINTTLSRNPFENPIMAATHAQSGVSNVVAVEEPPQWDSVESDDWQRSLLLHMGQDADQMMRQPGQQNPMYFSENKLVSVGLDGAQMDSSSYRSLSMAEEQHQGDPPKSKHPNTSTNTHASRSKTGPENYAAGASANVRNDADLTLTVADPAKLIDPALNLIRIVSYPELMNISSRMHSREKSHESDGLQQSNGKLPVHVVPLSRAMSTQSSTSDIQSKTKLAIFGNYDPVPDSTFGIHALPHPPTKPSTSRRVRPPSAGGIISITAASKKPVWRTSGPTSSQSNFDGGFGPLIEPLRISSPSLSQKERPETAQIQPTRPEPKPKPEPESESEASTNMPPKQLNSTVFSRQTILEQHREKAKEMARKARGLINAKAQKLVQREPSKPTKLTTFERDLDMFARIQSRVHQPALSSNERRSLASALNLNDDDGADQVRSKPAQKTREYRMPEEPPNDGTRLVNNLLSYTPESARHRRAHRRRASMGTESVYHINAVEEVVEVAGSSGDIDFYTKESSDPDMLSESHDGLSSIINNDNAGMASREQSLDFRHLRKSQSVVEVSQIKTPRMVLVPRHADVANGSDNNVAKDKKPQTAAERIEEEHGKEPDATKHRFRFFRDFEILLDREAKIQVDAANTLSRTGDIVPATARAIMAEDDLLAIAWNAFIHLRWIDEGPITEASAEAMYDAMVSSALNASQDNERRLADLEHIIIGMERKHYVYLKAFTGHLRRLAQASAHPITSGVAHAFTTLIFRCKCPETGDVYLSPQLTNFLNVRDTALATSSRTPTVPVLEIPSIASAPGGGGTIRTLDQSPNDLVLEASSSPLGVAARSPGGRNNMQSSQTDNDFADRHLLGNSLAKQTSKITGYSSTSSFSNSMLRQLSTNTSNNEIGTPTHSGMPLSPRIDASRHSLVHLDAATNLPLSQNAINSTNMTTNNSVLTSRTPSLAGIPSLAIGPNANGLISGTLTPSGSTAQPTVDTIKIDTTSELDPPLQNLNEFNSDPSLAQPTRGPMFVASLADAAKEFGWAEETPQSLELAVWHQHVVHTPFGAALELMMRHWNRIFSPQNDAKIGTV